MQRQTTTPVRKAQLPHGLIILLVMALASVAVLIGLTRSERRQHAIDPLPAVAIPTATTIPPTPSPTPALKLTLALPDMDQEQRYWAWKAAAVAVCPKCIAVDREPIPALRDNDDAYVVWRALIWTESKYRPWAVNESSGACGLGQLLSTHLANELTCAIPELNLYASAAEFARLLDVNGGDIMQALRSYKGVASADTTWQANAVFDVIAVGAK